jgi:competence ComEA-like helix-hairpin-helix protein
MQIDLQPDHQNANHTQSTESSSPFLGLQKLIVVLFNLSARLFIIVYPAISFLIRYTIGTTWFQSRCLDLMHYLFYPLAQDRDEKDQLNSPPRFLMPLIQASIYLPKLSIEKNERVISKTPLENQALLSDQQSLLSDQQALLSDQKTKTKKSKSNQKSEAKIIEISANEISTAEALKPSQSSNPISRQTSNPITPQSSNSITPQSSERKDINTATIEDLMQIDGMSKSRAEEVIRYREQFGAFKNIEEVTLVRGIGTKTTFALLARFEVRS